MIRNIILCSAEALSDELDVPLEVSDVIVNIDLDSVNNNLDTIINYQEIINSKIDNVITAILVVAIILGVIFVYKYVSKILGW